MITTEDRAAIVERVYNGEFQAMYELDKYVTEGEPFYKDGCVYPCMKAIPIQHLKTFEALHKMIRENVRSMTRLFVFSDDNHYKVFFAIHMGKNGNGDFMAEDLSGALAILQYLSTNTKYATFTEMSHDILDDVSDWGIMFEI